MRRAREVARLRYENNRLRAELAIATVAAEAAADYQTTINGTKAASPMRQRFDSAIGNYRRSRRIIDNWDSIWGSRG